MHGKCCLKALMSGIMMTEEFNKIQQVRSLESAVPEMFKIGQFCHAGIHAEMVWSHFHYLQQFRGLCYYCCTITPCKYGCKKSRDLNVLFPGKQVRNTNRVCRNEKRLIIKINLLV